MARKSSRSDEVAVVRPPSDAYTGLLALSLIAMIVSCVVLYLDFAQYGNTKAPAPAVPPVAKPATTTELATPNALAAVPSEPLPLPPAPVPSPIVQVIAESPADTPAAGPELTPPQ